MEWISFFFLSITWIIFYIITNVAGKSNMVLSKNVELLSIPCPPKVYQVLGEH